MGEVSLARRFDFFALAGVVPLARGVVERADVVSQRVDVCVRGFTVRVAFDCEIETEGITKIVRKVDFVDMFGEVWRIADVSGFAFFEGTMPPKTHPSWMFWNSVRFSPLFSTIDVLIGAVSARLVMIDGVEKVNFDSVLQKPVIPLLLMIGLIVGRGYSIVSMSDAIARSIFVPLFAWFTMNIHRETVSSSPRGEPIFNLERSVLETADVFRGDFLPYIHLTRTNWPDIL